MTHKGVIPRLDRGIYTLDSRLRGNDREFLLGALTISRKSVFILLAAGLLLAAAYLAAWSGPWIGGLAAAWLLSAPGMGLMPWFEREMGLEKFLALSIATSITLVVFILWSCSLFEGPLAVAFWLVWTSGMMLLAAAWWRVEKNKLVLRMGRPTFWLAGLFFLASLVALFEHRLGPDADILAYAASSNLSWTAGRVLTENPFVGGPYHLNTYLGQILALIAHAVHTHPIDLLAVERVLFTPMIGILFAALPLLAGFSAWSGVGTYAFLFLLSPYFAKGWTSFHYQTWALGCGLTGFFLIFSYLKEGGKKALFLGVVMMAAGCILKDFFLFYGCLSLAVGALAWLLFYHRQRMARRRVVLLFLISAIFILPIVLVRWAQVKAAIPIEVVNTQMWAKGPEITLFGRTMRYLPLFGVGTLQGFPVYHNFPAFLLLLAVLWPAWSRGERTWLAPLLLWPLCVLGFPPLYDSLSDVVALPTVRRLASLFPLYDAFLIGGAISVSNSLRARPIVLGMVAFVIFLRVPLAAVDALNRMEYHPPEWTDDNVWDWVGAYRILQPVKGEERSIVLDSPFLMEQSVTTALTGQKSLIGHSHAYEDNYPKLLAAARIMNPFLGREATIRAIEEHGIRYIILNKRFSPEAARAKFETWKGDFRPVHAGECCSIYEYLGSAGRGSEDPVDVRGFVPNISRASAEELPKDFEPIRFSNGIVLKGVKIGREGSSLYVSFWWSRTGDYVKGEELWDRSPDEPITLRGSTYHDRICFMFFHADLYGKGSLNTLRRRLLETLGRRPSRLAPYNGGATMRRWYWYPMIWDDWPHTIFENWPPFLWKEGEIWREDYTLMIPEGLLPGPYELRLRQGRYPASEDPGVLGGVIPL